LPNNIVFYFSGTGNSLKIAKEIRAAIDRAAAGEAGGAAETGGCVLADMCGARGLDGVYERIGFVFPCYFAGIPSRVGAFIKALDFTGNESAYIFAVASFGVMGPVNALAQLDRLLARKGVALRYNNFVRMAGNYVCLYPMAADAAEKARAAGEAIRYVTADVAGMAVNRPPRGSFLIDIYYKLFTCTFAGKDRHYNVSGDCDGCGLCARVCPAANIRMGGGRPRFLHACEQCMACIQWCPRRALNYKNKTQGRGRYHHPDITAGEMIKR